MPKLTVIIPCKDEAHNIRDCVQSVRPVADEVLVADSGSTDGTLDIVRQLGACRIIEREYICCSSFKNWAIPQAKHPWVLICDADERLSEELAEEIQQLLAGKPRHAGYEIGFRPYFLGYELRFSGIQSVTSIRLFRKSVSRYAQMRVHSDVAVSTGNVGRLQGRFLHYTCQCLNRFTQTQNRYSSWSAEDMYENGKRVGFWGVLLRPPLRFLQFYVQRLGFLDGIGGLLSCSFTAFYTFLKYAKLWELQHSKTIGARHVGSAHHNRTTDLDTTRPRAA